MTAMRPPMAERSQVPVHVRGAHQLQHDVVGTVVDEVVGGQHGGAEGGDARTGRLVAHGRDHVAARRHGELDGGGADPTRGAVDAHPLTHAELALREQGVVGGGVVLGKAACVGPSDALGHRDGDDLGHDGQLGLARAGDDGHDPVARAEAPAAGPEGEHFAGQLEPGQVGRRRAGRWRVQPLDLHEVAAAHAGGPHPHQQLAGSGLGVGLLAPGDPAVHDRHRVHARRPLGRRGGRRLQPR